jgi:hypothetical protein
MDINKLAPVLIMLVRNAIAVEFDATTLPRPTVTEWNELARLALAHDIAPLLRAGAARAGLHLPEQTAAVLRRKAVAWELRNARARAQLDAIVRAFNAEDVSPVLLKGALFAFHYYPDAGLRAFCDFDLLVPADARDRCDRVLASMGYALVDEFAGQSADRIARNQYHLFYTREGALPVEMHWSLTRPAAPVQFDAAGLSLRSLPIDGANGSARALGREDQILHLANHSAKHRFQFPLRQFIDLTAIVAALGEPDWAVLWERARAVGIAKDLALYLGTAAYLNLVHLPPAASAEVAKNLPRGIRCESLAAYAVSWPFLNAPNSLLHASAAPSLRSAWRALLDAFVPADRFPGAESSAPASTLGGGASPAPPPRSGLRSAISHTCHLFAKFGHLCRNIDQVKTAMLIRRHYPEHEG